MNISLSETFKKVTSVTLIFGLVFSTLTPTAFALTGGPQSGSSFSTVNSGGVSWNNPNNAQTSNDSYSTSNLNSGNRDSDDLQVTGFGFSIPSNATINGIQVFVEHSASANNRIRTNEVRMIKAGIKSGTAYDGTGNPYNWSTTDTVTTYGSVSDVWGTTWTPAQINASNFGVSFVARHDSNGGSVTARVDQIRITVTYTVPSDTTAPVISQVTAVPSPTADTTPNYTFTTNEAGTITYGGDCSSSTTAAVVGSNTVTFNALSSGIHSNCTIRVTDASSNASNILTVNSFTVDTTGPVITLNGSTPVTVEIGSVYTDAGATALDTVDGDRTANIITVNPVNTNVLGTYTVTYDVVDTLGNAATQVTRTVNVVDTTKPVISLVGSPTVSVNFGASYTDAGATASDNVDGTITGSIVTVNSVNTGALGTYTVTYNVTDTHGNAADQVTRTVNVVDVTAPVINIIGDNPMTIEVGGTYTEPGANAVDDVDGTFSATPSGSVDTNTVGTYTINYNATDTSSNAATQVTRTVNVVDTTAPVLTLLGITPTDAEWTQVYTDAGATASDNVDGDITGDIITVNPVNTMVIGVYTITYNVADNAGNDATEITRTVNVVDTIAPIQSSISVIPLNGSVSVKLNTNENATVSLSYGFTNSYGSTADITTTAGTTHDKTILGLSPCTVYHYSIVTTDIHGNISSSSDGEFTTLGVGSCTEPNNSGGSAQGGSPSSSDTTTQTNSESTNSNNTGNSTPTPPTTENTTPTQPTTPTLTAPETTPAPESTPTTPTENITPQENPEENNTLSPTPTPTPTAPVTGDGTGAPTDGTTGPVFNPADATLDIGGAGTAEETPAVEEAPTVNPTLDVGGGVTPEETSYTLLWTLLGLIALLNTWWFFVAKNKTPTIHRRD